MNRRSLKILLVEDDPGDAELTKEFLLDGSTVFEIENVTHLSQAIEMIDQERFDAILLDLGLPDSQGIETIRSMRKNAKNIPIVVQTGNNDGKIGIEAIKEGAQDFVVKGETSGDALSRILSFAIERSYYNKRLKESEQAISTLLEAVEIGIIVVDTKTRKIKIANPYACSLFEREKTQIEGRVCHNFICPSEVGKCPILDLGQSVDKSERELIKNDKSKSTVLKSVSEINLDGEKHLLEVFVDITDRKIAEENNLKLLFQVEHNEKLESLGVLAGGIAHDFNNLLAGLFGYIELTQNSCQDNETALNYLEKSLSVFKRAKDLTQQLLTFSKGGAPVLETGDISSVLKDSAAFVLSGSSVECIYDINRNLDLCDFDENQLSQVVNNIVINAQHAMPAGGKIKICADNIFLRENEVSSLKKGNFIKISISDSGIGVPPEMLNKIFDPFFTTKQKGSGLGLATCYSIITKHRGFIEVESIIGDGTTFHIYLPSSDRKLKTNIETLEKNHHGSGMFLVMDDEVFIREVVGEMLETFGYTVVFAKSGEQAISICKRMDSDGEIVKGAILDLTIPGGMGGKETIPHLKEIFSGIKLFAASGYSNDPVISDPVKYGFTGSLRKPFRINKLAENLNVHL